MRSPLVKVASFAFVAAVATVAVSSLAARADVSPTTAPSDAATAVATTSVSIKDFAFAPPTITVAAGSKVTFKNSDAIAHTVTATDKSFDSGNMDQNGTWSHVFDKAGTYKYICAYHTYMHGTVIVK